MSSELFIAVVSAGSALLGSIVGGIISFYTAHHLNEREWNQAQLSREIAKREDLYSEFIAECSRLILNSLDKKVNGAYEFVSLYTLLGKIRMMSSKEVQASAESLAKYATEAHTAGGVKTRDTGDSVFNSRNRFTEIARAELDEIKKQA